jgi:hypothetical protein
MVNSLYRSKFYGIIEYTNVDLMIRVMQIVLQPVLFEPDKEDVLISLKKVISE